MSRKSGFVFTMKMVFKVRRRLLGEHQAKLGYLSEKQAFSRWGD